MVKVEIRGAARSRRLGGVFFGACRVCRLHKKIPAESHLGEGAGILHISYEGGHTVAVRYSRPCASSDFLPVGSVISRGICKFNLSNHMGAAYTGESDMKVCGTACCDICVFQVDCKCVFTLLNRHRGI